MIRLRTRGLGRAHGRGSPARFVLAGLTVLSMATFGLVATGSPAFASVSTDAGFEFADGNLIPQPSINFDWNSFTTTTWTGNTPYRVSSKTTSGWAFTGLEDADAVTSDSGFAGGTKQDDDCATVNTGKAPNKDDLKRVYVTSKTVNGHVYLGLAWVRIPQNTTSPSAHIGFEFNKGTTACPAGSNGLVRRTAGDMLIVYDFEGGSTDVPVITMRRWVASGACEVANDTAPCWGQAANLTALGFAEAKVNTDVTVSDTISPTSPASVTLGKSEFGEAGIDLTAANVFSPTACESFGKIYAVSRSSGNSGTAQMKDLAGPGNINISNCGRVIIRKVTDPAPDPTDTTFGYTTTGGLSPSTFNLKNAAARDYGNTVLSGSYSVTETNPSPDFLLTGLDCSASSITHGTSITPSTATRTVSFTLKPLDTVDCTFTNTLQRGALRILKQSTKTNTDGTHPNVANAGAAFSVTGPAMFTVRDNNVGTPVGSMRDSSTTVGEVCVSGLAAGSYTVNETTPPPGYGASTQTGQTAVVVVGTDCNGHHPTDANTATFTNAPLADIQVNFRDGGSGETKLDSPIVCTNTDVTVSTTPKPDDFDASANYSGIPINPSPRTITCTIVIDP